MYWFGPMNKYPIASSIQPNSITLGLFRFLGRKETIKDEMIYEKVQIEKKYPALSELTEKLSK